jgi:hypothetical protein
VGKENCRSLGLPNFLLRLVALASFIRFSPTENRTRGRVSEQRGRKFGFARDDKGEGNAHLSSRSRGLGRAAGYQPMTISVLFTVMGVFHAGRTTAVPRADPICFQLFAGPGRGLALRGGRGAIYNRPL